MIEVMRILKALRLKLDRTVRLGLWSGEEQGIYGSRAYVKETFGDPATMQLSPRTPSCRAISTTTMVRENFAACICKAMTP